MGFKKNIFFILPIKNQQKWIYRDCQKLIFKQKKNFFAKTPTITPLFFALKISTNLKLCLLHAGKPAALLYCQ